QSKRDQEEAWPYSNARGARGKVAHTSAAERLCSTTSFDLPPLRKKSGGRRRNSARRPKAHLTSVATTGRRREQACQPKRSGGNPEGAGAAAQRRRTTRSARAASKEDVRQAVVGSVQGGGTGRAARPCALAASRPTAEPA